MPPIQPLLKRFPSFFVTLMMCACLLFLSNTIAAQSKWVIENYNYVGQKTPGAVVPIIHFETKKNWYAELRYNYEDNQTISFFGGKTIKGGKKIEYRLTPLVGYSLGNFTGYSVGTNLETGWNNIYIASQSQYSVATKKHIDNFFFSWSEIGYNISDRFFAGIAMQYTRQKGFNDFEPGFVAGLELGNFSFPCYVFSPFRSGSYFVIGVNYEYHLKNKKL